MTQQVDLLKVEFIRTASLPTGTLRCDSATGTLNIAVGLDRSTQATLTISDVTFDLVDKGYLSNIEILWPRERWKIRAELEQPQAVGTAIARFPNVLGHLVQDKDIEVLGSPDKRTLVVHFHTGRESASYRIASQVVMSVSQGGILTSLWIEGIEC